MGQQIEGFEGMECKGDTEEVLVEYNGFGLLEHNVGPCSFDYFDFDSFLDLFVLVVGFVAQILLVGWVLYTSYFVGCYYVHKRDPKTGTGAEMTVCS